jgi:hypothetical protein
LLAAAVGARWEGAAGFEEATMLTTMPTVIGFAKHRRQPTWLITAIRRQPTKAVILRDTDIRPALQTGLLGSVASERPRRSSRHIY